MKYRNIGIGILAVCVCIVLACAWAVVTAKDKELNVVASDVETEDTVGGYDYSIAGISTNQFMIDSAANLLGGGNSMEIIEEADGSYTINRTWGEKLTENDANSANIGSGGGEIPLAEDGVYYGDHQDEAAASSATPTTAPTTTPTATPTTAPASSSSSSGSGSSSSSTTSSSSGSSTPKGGDIKVDENGNTWVFVTGFGWVQKDEGYAGMIESSSDAIPGTGETIGTM